MKNKLKSEPSLRDSIISVIIIILLNFAFRSIAYEPFRIPSGSMKPNLLIGDYIWVAKYSYGYSKYSFLLSPFDFDGRIFFRKPSRGDIIVFKPKDVKSDEKIYVKRLIGLPGDQIQIKNRILYINDTPIERSYIGEFVDDNGEVLHEYQETYPSGLTYKVLASHQEDQMDNTGIYKVPEGHYFFLGDNRNNSGDSRILSRIGYIPEENLLGQVKMVFFSTKASWWEFWKWFTNLDTARFFLMVNKNA